MEKIECPEFKQSSWLLQKGHSSISPGHFVSLFFKRKRHRCDTISKTKPCRSENIFILNKSAPLPPALKAKGVLVEYNNVSWVEKKTFKNSFLGIGFNPYSEIMDFQKNT